VWGRQYIIKGPTTETVANQRVGATYDQVPDLAGLKHTQGSKFHIGHPAPARWIASASGMRTGQAQFLPSLANIRDIAVTGLAQR
jgi:hypothetical protein